jgi:aldose 1-epimerase
LIISNYGVAVISLFVKDKNGDIIDVVLGYDKHSDYCKDEFYLGTVVGRCANRIAGGKVQLGNRKYMLHTREGGYHLHGGLQGFNKKLFRAVPCVDKKNSRIKFYYKSPHLEEGFPGELDLEVTYTLDDFDAWTVEYRATTSDTTLINLTQHSYFNLSGNLAAVIDNHKLKIPAKYYLPVNEMQVPIGEIAEVKNTPFDFTEFRQISDGINIDNVQLKLSDGYDHSLILEHSHSPGLKHAATVVEPNTKIKLDVYTTEPAVHFYSGNFLNNVKGKNGVVYNQRSGFCLETQHFPDAPNHSHFPSIVLNPGQEYYSKTVFKFALEK